MQTLSNYSVYIEQCRLERGFRSCSLADVLTLGFLVARVHCSLLMSSPLLLSRAWPVIWHPYYYNSGWTCHYSCTVCLMATRWQCSSWYCPTAYRVCDQWRVWGGTCYYGARYRISCIRNSGFWLLTLVQWSLPSMILHQVSLNSHYAYTAF